MVCHGTCTVLVDTFNIGRCVKSRAFSSSPPSDPVTRDPQWSDDAASPRGKKYYP